MTIPYKTVAVCGPTAAGKSALSISLARALAAEVVNVDSVQLYKGFDIGSAKLTERERGGVSHHLLDIFEPTTPVNVALFRAAALDAISNISARGKIPLLVGGSGMYLTVLLHGLADVPATPVEIREAISMLSPEGRYAELSVADPQTAERLNPGDLQRVSRALEIVRVTGKKPSELFAQHNFAPVEVVSLVLVICRPRDELYKRIEARSALMVEGGLVEESRNLLERYGEVSALNTLGYKQACDLLKGKLELKNLAAEISLHTRRFAKRQMTYWRNEPLKRGWLVRPGPQELAQEVTGFESFPARAQSRIKSFRTFALTPAALEQAVKQRLEEPLERTEVWYIVSAETNSN